MGWDWWLGFGGGLGLVAGFWWWVVSLFAVCGAAVMVGGFGGSGCWVGILVIRDDGCL